MSQAPKATLRLERFLKELRDLEKLRYVPLARFELAALWSEGRCSNHLAKLVRAKSVFSQPLSFVSQRGHWG